LQKAIAMFVSLGMASSYVLSGSYGVVEDLSVPVAAAIMLQVHFFCSFITKTKKSSP
jgi:hypothetical protein